MTDCEILAIYSHMISNALYLPDYPLGHIIAFQVARSCRARATSAPSSSAWPARGG